MPKVTPPTRTGYAFGGYYDASSGGTKYYNTDGTSARNWDKASVATLYARWTATTSTVTLNKNGGTGGTASVTATFDAGMPSITVPTYAGYTFQGYYDATSGGTKYYNANGTSARTWNKVGAQTLYARWSANTYTITYLGNGNNSGSMATTSCTFNNNCTLRANTFVKNSYTFVNWLGNNNVTYGNSATFKYTIVGNLNLTAQWKLSTFTVTLNKNGGTGGTASVTATYGSAMPAISVPSRTGYTFQGYYDSTSGGTKYYNANGTSANIWNKTAASTLYAQWKANTYTVTLNRNGGSGGTASVTATYNSAMPRITIPTYYGYAFQGYYDSISGGTQYYKSDGTSAKTWNKTGASTLYARWTADCSRTTKICSDCTNYGSCNRYGQKSCSKTCGNYAYYNNSLYCSSATSETKTVGCSNFTGTLTVCTANDPLRLRYGPGTNYDQIYNYGWRVVNKGTTFHVTEGPKSGQGCGSWFKGWGVSSDKDGWACGDYLC